jgi:rare lipoprotein A
MKLFCEAGARADSIKGEMRRRTLFVLVSGCVLGACRKHRAARRSPPSPAPASGASRARPTAPPAPPGWNETGVASWYGVPYHGRRAANGEIYDMEQLTAAHKTLPFNTQVRVTSLTNGRTVIVRITDRGPFIEGRIIDLSKAAAREMALIGPGIMKVRIEVIGPASHSAASSATQQPATQQPATQEPATLANSAPLFGVQIGAFEDRKRAERIREEARRQYGPVRLIARDAATTQWRVVVGEKPTQQEALELASELQRLYREAFVVRIDSPAGPS